MTHAILNTKTDDCRHAAYVARPSPLGNPYAIGPDGDRGQVIERYRAWLDARVKERDPVVCTSLLGITQNQALACHCAPLPCHAEVIADLLNDGIQDRLKTRTGHAGGSLAGSSHSLRYAGIGSRSTPDHVLQTMRKIAHRLSELGYTLLSGGAAGADSAFEEGCFGKKKIYLPWPGFRHLQGRHCVTLPSAEAYRVAEAIHPTWKRLNDTAQALMARNSHQVLGTDLRSPVDFVVCWTPDNCESEATRSRNTGGTGQAIALANRWGIPVVNLAGGKVAMNRMAELVMREAA
ncbi:MULTISPECIES: DUF4326 domain-containing protein [Acidithiobacillus]|nr:MULTISPECIES: DUF4326 domain-containing protein [Acidithiobacillus]MEB8476667.1 DUF4326 domain-containing protein [Acidithiobacillus ferriphilus]MEB8486023.1 DUF4326 domain-containing protein [Acidithiobacillus ferriphilus]MEB8489586.1 DUF4326 domain-containing protein [Acidithiobacillus ferriphilus]MEB8492471.1 DUF4326 domain-containing protein [Acidithiobacillus ferriphilus]MEB8515411.1 DUF4326 domain-containing protein [Acidithiobacillus ferriphilus]